MEKNPLRNLSLDARIDIAITGHFKQGWLNDFGDEFFNTGVFKIYHINFILGLLCSIKSNKREQNVFYSRIGDKNENLRIFILRNERIIFHDILYTASNLPTWKQVTKDELDDLVLTLRELHFKLEDTIDFQMFRYIVVNDSENSGAKSIVRMDLVEDLTLTFEMPEKGLSETPKKGPSESVTLAKKVLSTIHTCDISFWIYFDNFGKERSNYFLSKYDRYKLVEQAARLHASIFENMPDTYGNILRNSRLPAVSYRRGAVSLCLPKKDTSNEYIMFNVPWKKTAIYHFLLTHGRNDLVIYTMANKYREFKPVKLTLQNILHDIKEDLSIKKDVSFITDYLEVIGQFFKMQGIRTKEHLEAFFLGLLIAVDDALTRACVGAEKNNAFPIELIFFLDDECELFFTFKNDAKSSPPSEKNGGKYILQLNFATSTSDNVDFQISTMYAVPWELWKNCRFVEHTPPKFNHIIPRMIQESNAESFSLLMSELQTNLEALIANAKKLSVVNSNLGAYFAGIISHFGDWRYVNSNAISFQVHRNYSILFAFGPEISCTMLSSQCKDSTYSMAIGYNMESDQMSILGLVLENLRSTMDNPSKISVCSAIKEEKYSKEEVAKESIIENNTKVTIEPEKIDEKLNDYRKEEIAKESIMENNGKVTMELEKIDEKLNDYDEEPRQCTDADFE